MYKLRKMYLGTIGNESSWHNGTLLDFTKQDDPIDTYGCLINGGGKTTIVGFFFSVFVPDRKKFIPHVVNSSLNMDDYYKTNVPGYVAIEWEFTPKSEAGSLPLTMGMMPKLRYVTGTIGYKSLVNGRLTLERIFYSVKLGPNFSFEELPLPIINNEEAAKILSLEDVRKWASAMKSKLGDSFFWYSMQSDWEKHLTNIGFSLHDFKVQMRMNHEEGGATKVIDDLQHAENTVSKRDFRFVEWMLNIILDQDVYAKYRNSLFESCKSLKDVPKAEEALQLLNKMEDSCVEIATIVNAIKTHGQELANVNNDIEYTHQYLAQVLRDVEFLHMQESAHKSSCENGIKELKSELQYIKDKEVVISFNIAHKKIYEIKSEIESKKEEKKVLEANKSLHEDVIEYFPIYEKAQELQEYNKQISGIKDSDTAVELKQTIAGVLYLIASSESEIKLAQAKRRDTKKSQETELRKTESTQHKAEKDYSELNRKFGEYNGWLRKADEELISIISSGALIQGIDPETQLESHKNDLKAVEHKAKSYSDLKIQHSNERQNTVLVINQNENKIKNDKKERLELLAKLDRHYHRVSAIKENKFFIHHLGESSIIDSRCIDSLTIARHQKEVARDDTLSSLAILEKIKVKADKFNIPVSDDLWVVLQFLTERSITAYPAISYIYDTFDNPDEAASKNNAYTQAVVVYDLDSAEEALSKPNLTIFSPVFLVDAKNILDFDICNYSPVVSPSDYVINKRLATEFVSSIDYQIEQTRLNSEELRKESESILDLQKEIQAFISDYAKTFPETTSLEITKTETAIANCESSINSDKEKLVLLQGLIEDNQGFIDVLTAEQKALTEKITRLDMFIINTWRHKVKQENEVRQIKESLDAKGKEIELLKLDVEKTKKTIQLLIDKIQEEENLLSSLDRNRRKVSSIFDNIVPESNQRCQNIEEGVRTIDVLNRIYQNQLHEIGYDTLIKAVEDLRIKIEELEAGFYAKPRTLVAVIEESIRSNPSLESWKANNKELYSLSTALEVALSSLNRDLHETENSIPAINDKLLIRFADIANETKDNLVLWKSECLNRISLLVAQIETEDKIYVDFVNSVAALLVKKNLFKNNVDLFKRVKASNLPCDYSSYVPVHSIVQDLNDSINFTQVKDILFTLSDEIASKIEAQHALYGEAFDRYKEMLLSQVFEDMEKKPDFVECAKRTTRESLKEDGEIDKLVSNIKDVMKFHEHCLVANKTLYTTALDTLIMMFQQGRMVIDKACSKSRCVPDGVRYIGGKQILRRTSDRGQKLGDEAISILCGMYLTTLIQTPNFPKSGIDIVLDLLRKTNETGFGFKFVKYTPILSSQYESIEKLAMSGGERVLTSVMLYLLVRAVRAEIYDNTRSPGGFLFFDNPFGKITSPDFIDALKSIVHHASCQLIAFSTIRTEAINNAFDNFIIMAKSTKLVGGSQVGLISANNEDMIGINTASYTMRAMND